MLRIKSSFIFALLFFGSAYHLESMERFKKSLPFSSKKNRKENNDFYTELDLACKKHDFRMVAQIPSTHEHLKKQTNLAIQYYFLKKIRKAKSLEKLQEVHIELVKKIDFFENGHEYELFGQHIYDKHLALSKS